MRTFKIHLSILILITLTCITSSSAQPCIAGISTDPSNPINNQFVQMGNNFFPGNGVDTYNPYLNRFDWYFGNSTIQLFPNEVNWTHGFSNLNNVIQMQHPYGGAMPTEFQYLRPTNVNPSFRYFWLGRWMGTALSEPWIFSRYRFYCQSRFGVLLCKSQSSLRSGTIKHSLLRTLQQIPWADAPFCECLVSHWQQLLEH